MLQFDDETAGQVESTDQTPDIVEQRRATRAQLALKEGEHVLDIGSGPGFLAAEMAGGTAAGPDRRARSEREHAGGRPPPRRAGGVRRG